MLTPDENGTVIAEAPDLPGTITFGQDEAEVLDMALDASLTMLYATMDDGEDIPRPNEPTADQPVIELPPMAVVKLAANQAMKDQCVSQLKMAARLHTDPKSVCRLLDLYYHSKWDHLETGPGGPRLLRPGARGAVPHLPRLFWKPREGTIWGMIEANRLLRNCSQ